MKKELLKKAALTLRNLTSERDKLANVQEVNTLARELVGNITKQSELSAKEVLEKLAEFETKTSEELKLIQKALEFSHTKEFAKLGNLTEDTGNVNSVDNLTAFLISGE
jgi:hypothetical protein